MTETVKVTNKHSATLAIGNQSARPGATVEVNKDVYEAWADRPTAAAWLKAGLIVKGKGDGTFKEDVPNLSTVTTGKTGGEGLQPGEQPAGSNAALEGADAGKADVNDKDGKTDRKARLDHARALGLNPNNTVSNAKLDQMIADAEAK